MIVLPLAQKLRCEVLQQGLTPVRVGADPAIHRLIHRRYGVPVGLIESRVLLAVELLIGVREVPDAVQQVFLRKAAIRFVRRRSRLPERVHAVLRAAVDAGKVL